jgi:hypothetical protein
MKSLIVLWKHLADELAGWCHVSTTLDYKKLERRVEHEGDQFLMITLPRFGKDFLRSLELGKVDAQSFQGFKRKDGLPLFLGGFLRRVFDCDSGVLLDEPCLDSIFAIHQLTQVYKKIERPVSDDRVARTLQGFVQVEEEVASADEVLRKNTELMEEFMRIGGLLWADVFTEVDREIRDGTLMPKHGPGSTADGLFGNEKYNQIEWTERLEVVFPFLENALPGFSYARELDHVTFLEPEAERPVKVVTVPKTLEAPRIIAIEPTCMQFMQQAIAEAVIQKLESRNIGLNTRQNAAYGFVGFSDQNPNRDMARIGSRDKTLATLDMSEASDRVSNLHVELLTRRWPALSQAVQAVRSSKADVPTQGIIPLSKHASMGSALCFPMEAMVFTTLVFIGIQTALSTRFTRKDILALRGQVRVYGDDIICPVDSVDSVISTLEAFGLKVNTGKSYWNGKFRESCGGDYYDDEWITPIRVRRDFPTSRKQAPEVASMVSLRNQLYFAGFWKTCRWLDRRIEELLTLYPVIASTAMWEDGAESTITRSNLLGRASFLPPQGERMHRALQKPLVKGYVVSAKIPPSNLEGPGALVKWFLKRGDEPFQDKRHLERAGRPRCVDINIAWRSPV